MKRVTGIGGIFFKSADPQKLAAWYQRHLGLNIEAWGGVIFTESPSLQGNNNSTTWCPFQQDTEYFAPSTAPFMINYRVENLAELLQVLKAEGVHVDDKIESSEYGQFGWVIDPEGNKIELWQPPSTRI